MLPSAADGRKHVVEGLVFERPALHSPLCVEVFGRAVLLFEVGAEPAPAQRTITALVIGEDLVIDLPADDPGVFAERLGKLRDDDAVFLAHDGRGLARVTAGKHFRARAVRVDGARFGIFIEQPPRRRAGRRTHDDVNARLIELVHRAFQPAEVEFSLFRFHFSPCELRHTDDVHARFLHADDVAVDFALFPHFGIIRRADVNFLHECFSFSA